MRPDQTPTNSPVDQQPPESRGSAGAALLAATGFEKYIFGPEPNDACERCNTPNVQLYFGNKNYWTPADGDYWCLNCLHEVKEAIDRYAEDLGFKDYE